ncbi:Protein translocase subunit SecD [uncultured Alphaproteobacteria bacterium]|uniref:Protein translocase subunit SecD n=1 Tax=uncultured Alphaproteobacteria bacterium TaxID=91750 RepID=A0A212J2R6_9PROT|nr:Protein translocase subunit SecD [uncultured Alphaproteobacteria bacterium]
MLYIQKWKLALIALVVGAGLTFAAPNLVGRDTSDKMPSWLQPLSLGLDLQGGSHLLLELNTAELMRDKLDGVLDVARTTLRTEKLRYTGLAVKDGAVVATVLGDDAERGQARRALRNAIPNTEIALGDDGALRIAYGEAARKQMLDGALSTTLEIVRKRIDELGTREPSIQRQGDNRIVVQLPGVSDPKRAREVIGKTARMTFHLLDTETSVEDALRGRVPPGSMLLEGMNLRPDGQKQLFVVRKKVEVAGEHLVDAQPTFDQSAPVVSFRFDALGGRIFGKVTQENVGRNLAIVLDNKVVSAPSIRGPILQGSGVITGGFTVQEANDLALVLRSGALPTSITFLEERSVGPSLGADSIRAGTVACFVGLALVVGFMVVAYGLFGVFANVALLCNMVLLIGGLSAIGATLTLPGIAGIVLTMGMAVDANVLIFERMREETRNGRSPLSSIESGFDRAFATIFDANITTLAAAALLYQFGSGPVRGFAVTLSLGILTSMFSAVLLTRLMVVLWARRGRRTALPI